MELLDKLLKGDKRFTDIRFLPAVLGMGPIVKFLRKLVADVPIIRVISDVAMPLAYKLVWTLRIPVGGFTTCAAVVA